MSSVKSVKLSSKGQVVIPKQLREELKLEAGDTLAMARHGDAIIIRKLSIENLLEESLRNLDVDKTLSIEETLAD